MNTDNTKTDGFSAQQSTGEAAPGVQQSAGRVPQSMVSIAAELTSSDSLQRAIALGSFESRVENHYHNAEIVRYCRACCRAIGAQEAAQYGDIFCTECRAMQNRGWLPDESERDEIIRRAKLRRGELSQPQRPDAG